MDEALADQAWESGQEWGVSGESLTGKVCFSKNVVKIFPRQLPPGPCLPLTLGFWWGPWEPVGQGGPNTARPVPVGL